MNMFDLKAIETANRVAVEALEHELPEMPKFDPRYRRAPSRGLKLDAQDTKLAIGNALRYVHPKFHAKLAPEFLEELKTRGRIYGYRFRPEGHIRGLPISEYRGKCLAGKALLVMLDNNLDFDIALYPYELVTSGETG